MASETVPAAVPGPHDPPPSTAPTTPANSGAGQQPTGVAGLLAPMEATRTAFTLTPETATTTTEGEQAVTDASSAGFTAEDAPADAQEKNGKATSGKQQQSVIKAWMLAGAERWKKGADARNKRLDIQKEKAKARQVKETVTVNRSEKVDSGAGNPSKGNTVNTADKSLGGKSNGAGKSPGAGSKNTSGPAGSGKPGGGRGNAGSHKQDAGRSGAGTGFKDSSGSAGGGLGRGGTNGGSDSPSSTRNGGSGRGGTDKQTAGKSGTDSGNRSKDSKPKQVSAGNTCGDTGGTEKPAASSPAGKPGKDGSKDSGAESSKTSPKPSDGKTTEPSGKTTPAPGSDTTPASDKKTSPKDPAKPGDTSARPGTDTAASSKKKPSTAADAAKTSEKTDLTKATDAGKATDSTPTPRINLQTSREAGYRDGTRAAKAVAHATAWRDGTRDGYRDTTEAANRERARLDKAHADRKQSRTSPEDTSVTQPASSTDYQTTVPPKPTHTPGPQPVPVTSVDSTHVHLGDAAARPSISRGEVRTLRNFQQQLQGKTDRMTMVAEATRTLEDHANEQAKQVTQLLEQARGVKGGDKLAAALSKLADAAQVQATKAAEIHKRAVRSSEACKSLYANSETRYGGIYKAVIDSPETSPAEMNYYSQMETAGV